MPDPVLPGEAEPQGGIFRIASKTRKGEPSIMAATLGYTLTVAQQYIASWNAVNATLGATPFVLPGGYAVATLIADRTALLNANTATESGDNDRQIAATNRDLSKALLLPRVAQFRGAVRGALPGTGFAGATPNAPNFSSVESRFLRPFDDMAALWSKINAATGVPNFTPPLLLGTYTLANFNTDITTLRTQYQALYTAEEITRLSRRQRDVLVQPLRNRLKQYRDALIGRFGPKHPFVVSLPALSPPAGSTPAAVSASGVWNAALSHAVLTWVLSDNPAVTSYSVRYCPGTVYRASDESVVASVGPTETTLQTDVGLAAPGAVALYRVYVVLSTGNEKGSATVKITRP